MNLELNMKQKMRLAKVVKKKNEIGCFVAVKTQGFLKSQKQKDFKV